MKKHLLCGMLAVALLVCVLALSSCGKDSGTYYLYEDGLCDSNTYITLSGTSWQGSGGLSGRLQREENRLALYVEENGREVKWSEGTVFAGGLHLTVGGKTADYYLLGSAPIAGYREVYGEGKMPQLVGRHYTLEELPAFVNITKAQGRYSTLPAGTILEQSVPAGADYAGEEVTVWVSYGRETVTVRISGHLTGVLEQLKARFPDSRITVEEVRTAEVPTGWVLPVTLSVTTGDDILLQVNVMDVTLSPVPDVCGLPYEQAREVLEKAGFTVEMDVYTGTDTPEKTVGATLPAAGEYVLPGSKVTVYYRMG